MLASWHSVQPHMPAFPGCQKEPSVSRILHPTSPSCPPQPQPINSGWLLNWWKLLQWLRHMEVSDRGERTKEARIGDSLEEGKKQQRKSQILQHHQLAKLQNCRANTWEREEGKAEYDFDPDWSLQHDCLAFSQGIKRWQWQPENLFFLLHVWLCYVLSFCKDTFQSSIPIYSAWPLSYEWVLPVDGDPAAHSSNSFFLSLFIQYDQGQLTHNKLTFCVCIN